MHLLIETVMNQEFVRGVFSNEEIMHKVMMEIEDSYSNHTPKFSVLEIELDKVININE